MFYRFRAEKYYLFHMNELLITRLTKAQVDVFQFFFTKNNPKPQNIIFTIIKMVQSVG